MYSLGKWFRTRINVSCSGSPNQNHLFPEAQPHVRYSTKFLRMSPIYIEVTE